MQARNQEHSAPSFGMEMAISSAARKSTDDTREYDAIHEVVENSNAPHQEQNRVNAGATP